MEKINKRIPKVFLFICTVFLAQLSLKSQAEVSGDEVEPFIMQFVDLSETYIGAHFGISMPSKEFSQTNPSAQSGFAKTGYKMGLDGSFIFFRNMGLGWTFGYSVNPFDEAAYLKAIHYRLPKAVQIEEINGTVTAGNWRSTWLTIGPYLSLPEEKFMFDFGMYVGLAYANMPKITFAGQFNGQGIVNQEIVNVVENDGSITGALMIQGSGNWFIKDNIRIFIKGEMLFARPELRKTITTDMETFYLRSIADEDQSINMLNLAVGVAYEFENKQSKKAQPKSKRKKAMEKKKKKFLKKRGK